MAAFKKCPWTPEEDMRLVTYISRYGIWNWSQMPKNAGLSRSGKSCRLRWMNYLDPQVKRGNYTQEEDEIIINMRHVGAGWSAIAARLSGRTDNEIKNRWHTHLKKRIANNVVENMEHAYLEKTEVKTDEIMKYDYTDDHIVTPEAPNLDEDYEEGPVSFSISNFEAYSNNNNVPPTFGTSADPHTSFWREPFALDNIYEYATYVDPQFGMPRPQDWFREPFYTYYDLLYMKSRGMPNSCI